MTLSVHSYFFLDNGTEEIVEICEGNVIRRCISMRSSLPTPFLGVLRRTSLPSLFLPIKQRLSSRSGWTDPYIRIESIPCSVSQSFCHTFMAANSSCLTLAPTCSDHGTCQNTGVCDCYGAWNPDDFCATPVSLLFNGLDAALYIVRDSSFR